MHFFRKQVIQMANFIDDLALGALTHAIGIADIMNRVPAGLKLNPLITAWQHAAGPLAGGDRLKSVFAL